MSSLSDRPGVVEAASRVSTTQNCDVLIYNGGIERFIDLQFIEKVHANQSYDSCTIIVVSSGGDPDAAYKMSRYLQEKYKHVSFVVSGLCKSAGTLMAIGAHELVFTPYGELGPLDVQTFKEDKISGLQSGLNISEALQTLEYRALMTYNRTIDDILRSSGGIVSFPTASNAACQVIAALYRKRSTKGFCFV